MDEFRFEPAELKVPQASQPKERSPAGSWVDGSDVQGSGPGWRYRSETHQPVKGTRNQEIT